MTKTLAFVVLFLVLCCGTALASPIVFNTGVASDDTLIALGATDSHFLLFPSTCCGSGLNINAFPTTFLNDGSYSGAPALSDTATAEWIGYTGFGPFWANGSNATAAFSETFTLTAGDIAAGGLSISGELGFTGTFVGVNLNGVNDPGAAFTEDYGASLHPFDVTSGFQVGTNTLTFVESWTVADGTAHGNSSEGLIVDGLTLTGGATVPEPGTMLLFGTAGLIAAWKRKQASR